MRDLIREDEKRKAEERLEALLLEGLSGDESTLTREEFAEIRTEALAQVQAYFMSLLSTWLSLHFGIEAMLDLEAERARSVRALGTCRQRSALATLGNGLGSRAAETLTV